MRRIGVWAVVFVLVAVLGAPQVAADTLNNSPVNEPAANGANVPAVFTQWARVMNKTWAYASPGGARAQYLDNYDTWVSVRGSQWANGQTWYRTGSGRWVSANDVRIMGTTGLRGYQFRGDEPGGFGYIMNNGTHVHDQPHGGANDLGYLARYTPLSILGMDNGWWRIANGQWVHPNYVRVVKPVARPAGVGVGEKWIDINLTQQTVAAYEGDRMVYATLTSTGKGTTPTITGFYYIYEKHISHQMAGGWEDNDPYILEEVPWTMYFTQRYALHGAYWHDQFGTVRSHGCVNLSPEDAKWLFTWSGPVVAPGANSVWASANNRGTWVNVHY